MKVWVVMKDGQYMSSMYRGRVTMCKNFKDARQYVTKSNAYKSQKILGGKFEVKEFDTIEEI